MDHVPLGGSTEGALPALYPAGHQVDPSSVAMMPVVERILLPSWRPRQRGNDEAAGIVMTALSALRGVMKVLSAVREEEGKWVTVYANFVGLCWH